MSDGVLDQPVMIGARKTLVGIVTQPTNYEPTDQPVFLILNSGIIHRVGHHRMYVTLARLLAGLGRQVLRFDLSGIGDSDSREDARSIFEGALADVREAIDWLFAQRGARRVILVGLCSGADQALVYGISDPRVCGLVLLDPSIPPTVQHALRYFLKRSIAPEAWLKFGTGRGLFWRTMRKRLGLVYDDGRERFAVNLNDPAVRGFLQDAYQRAVDLEIKCLAVFTSGLPHQYSYGRQILDAFPKVDFKGNLQLEYFAGCDHVFSSRSDRNRLFRTMLDWIQNTRFAGPASGDPDARQDTDPKAPNELTPLGGNASMPSPPRKIRCQV